MLSKPITVMLTLAAVARTAFAQDQREWDRCIGREGPIPEIVIKGCSRTIEDTQNAPTKLVTAHNNRLVAFRLKGEYDLAFDDYSEAIRLNPNSANYYNNLGVIYRIKHDYDRAITNYDKAILLKRDYVAAYYNRALAYSDKGEYNKALADFGVVLQFNPRNAFALYARGLTYSKKGSAEAAKADIDAAATINPGIAQEFDRSQ
jgi:tetratricopeptide (TPR) repeat protein